LLLRLGWIRTASFLAATKYNRAEILQPEPWVKMNPHKQLVLASITFTLLFLAVYLAFSIWLAGGYDSRRLVIWTTSGLLVGLLWYLGMRFWLRKSGRL
jgi:hypothetical protein